MDTTSKKTVWFGRALSGLVAAMFFLVLRQIIAKDIFPRLTRAVGGDILKLVIGRLFILALIAMALGFTGYVIAHVLPTDRKPSDSITVNLPAGLTLKSATKFLAQLDNFTPDFKEGCDEAFLSAEVEPGPLTGSSTVELIELLRLHFKSPQARSGYRVKKVPEKGVYEISCN